MMILSMMALFDAHPWENESTQLELPVPSRISYTLNTPIYINGNADFLGPNSSTGIIRGSGTLSDPYIIEGIEIDSAIKDSILITNTTAYLVIQYSYFHSSWGAAINLKNATNVTIHSNLMLSNGWIFGMPAINIDDCFNINIINNRFIDNNFGIFAYESRDTNIMDNRISGGDHSIRLQSSVHFLIANNNFTDSFYGVSLFGCSNITVYHNNFINNGIQATDDRGPENLWDLGYPGGGNYWSDYIGTDSFSGPFQNISGPDGIGDSPYIIDANSSDRYPLIRASQQENTPPVAKFEVTPTIGNQTTTFTFDASNSSDAEDPVILLQFRWDFDGDGNWDTLWSRSPTVQFYYYFYLPGNYTVHLEVRDTAGKTNSTSRNITLIKDTPYLFHDKIRINGNSEFIYSNGVVGGNGTESNPYLIEDWEIRDLGTWDKGIEIINTDAYFIIRHVYIYSPESRLTQTGIRFSNVKNGIVENVSVMTVRYGLDIYGSSDCAIRNCSITNCTVGIRISNSFNVNFYGCIIANNSGGIAVDSQCDSIIMSNNRVAWNHDGISAVSISTFNRNLAIFNNTFVGNKYSGMVVKSAMNVTLFNNSFIENSYMAMYLEEIQNIFIKSNTIVDNSAGIIMYNCFDSLISNNTFINNSLSIFCDQLSDYTDYEIENNYVNGEPLVFLKNIDNITLNGASVGELILVNCTNLRITNSSSSGHADVAIELAYVNNSTIKNCNLLGTVQAFSSNDITIMNNNLSTLDIWIDSGTNFLISHNRMDKARIGIVNCDHGEILSNSICNNSLEGIFMLDSSNVRIFKNIISSNNVGIFLYRTSQILIDENEISSNDRAGIILCESSSNNIIVNNSIRFNLGFGLSIESGHGNCIWNNSFVNNCGSGGTYHPQHIQSCDNSSGNQWYNPNGFGNYWSDWTSPDTNMDGIVDNPYVIYGLAGAKDYYPLTQPGNTSIDELPPTTMAVLSGTAGLNDWYLSDVTITLTATDSESIVNYTRYRIDGGSWQNYSSPFVISIEGNHTLEFYSVDVAGNIEDIRFVQVKIDKVAPFLSISYLDGIAFPADAIVIEWNVSDETSGIADILISVDDGIFKSIGSVTNVTLEGLAAGDHTILVRVIDKAGLITEKTLNFKVSGDETGLGALDEMIGIIAVVIIACIVAAIFFIKRKKGPTISPSSPPSEDELSPPSPPSI